MENHHRPTNQQQNNEGIGALQKTIDKTLEVNKNAISRSYVIIPLGRRWIWCEWTEKWASIHVKMANEIIATPATIQPKNLILMLSLCRCRLYERWTF